MLLKFAAELFLVVLVFSQLLIPAIMGTQFFPWFRPKRSKLLIEIEKEEERVVDMDLGDELAKQRDVNEARVKGRVKEDVRDAGEKFPTGKQF